MDRPLRVVVLLSGRGSNLQALLEAAARPGSGFEVVAALADQPAAGLALALAHGIPAECIERAGFADRAAFEAELERRIAAHAPGLVVLAGFMRVLSAAFVERHAGRLLNIHPSLLPRWPGLHTHARALQAGDAEHGASVHLVIAALDAGPVLARVRIPVNFGDDERSLADRLLPREHRLLCACVAALASKQVEIKADAFSMRGTPLTEALELDDQDLLLDSAGRPLAAG